MPKYKVLITPQAYEYDVHASDAQTAEMNAMERHNGGNYMLVGPVEVKELAECHICEEKFYLEDVHTDTIGKHTCEHCIEDTEKRD